MGSYDLTTTDFDANKRKHAIWLIAADGSGQPMKLAEGASPRWAPDSSRVFFLAPVNDVAQVWSLNPSVRCIKAPCTAAEKQQVTDLPIEVGSFRIAPNGQTLVVSLAVFPDAEDPAATKARQDAQAKRKSTGLLYNGIFIRHWDTWADGTRNHLFALALGADGKAKVSPVALMKGFDGDAPSKPFGDDGDYAISSDSKSVFFSARLAGKTEPWSTNFDLWQAPLDGASAPVNTTARNMAWDTAPAFSVDGKQMAYRAMKRAGFEADRYGIFLSQANGAAKEVDPQWDRSASAIAWSGDGRTIYTLAGDVGHARIFAVNVASGAALPLTGDGHVSDFDVAHTAGGDVIVYGRDTLDGPSQIYAMKPDQAPAQLTHADADKLAGVDFSAFEQFSFTGWNHEKVYAYVVKPHGWQPGHKYPTVFMIHGGPQGSFGDGWSYRWNPQVWAGWGYGVVMVDFHGSTGYGQAFTDAISGHWGDRPLEDLQKGWAAAATKYPWIDTSRACAAGASYGGFMVYWIAGNWNQPFKCFVDHDGVFDNRIMGYATEELWFSEWENGHTPVWANPANYERFNPINHVANWTKPMLVIHSANDFRIPIDQGIAAFTALAAQGHRQRISHLPQREPLGAESAELAPVARHGRGVAEALDRRGEALGDESGRLRRI